MAIVDFRRLTSGTNTQVDAISRENAVMKAINKAQGSGTIQDAVLIGNVPGGIWPVLSKYENDTSGGDAPGDFNFAGVPSPQFIWDDNTFTDGEVRFFAQAVKFENDFDHAIFAAVFADNAHRLFLEERAPDGLLIDSFTPDGGLADGLMTATASQTDDKVSPFNWQKIRLWSSDGNRPDSTDNFLVVSFEVMNYNTNDTINPAGLAYLIDLYNTDAEIIDVVRLTSGSETQADATSRENAIQKALHKEQDIAGTQDAVVIGNAPGGIWPVLAKYDNDTSGAEPEGDIPFPAVPPPQFIWDDNTFEDGEVRYFARAFPFSSLEEHLIFVAVFADDAHRLFIEEWTPEGTLVQSFTPPEGLFDGTMVANASQNENKTAPFNWQKIRLWSSDDISPASSVNFLVVSFEVINYNKIDSVNPAGLAYLVDVYKED